MTHSTPAFRPATDLTWEEMAPGVRRTLVAYNDDLLLVKVAFETGAIGALHQHVHSQITYVESGEFEATVDGETRLLKAGDSFYAARPELLTPMVEHGVLAIEMEASALYTIAAGFGRRALCIATVSDHIVTGEETTSAERQETFRDMVEIALAAGVSGR